MNGPTISRWRKTPASAIVLLVVVLAAACAGGEPDVEETVALADDETSPEQADPDQLGSEIQGFVEEAESRGLRFITSREELIDRAMDEGTLRVQSATDLPDELAEAWAEDYPEIPIQVDQTQGPAAQEQFLLEVESGMVTDTDVTYVSFERYEDYLEIAAPFDIYGMAEAGILENIPLEAIDTENRNVVATGSNLVGFGYNPDLLPEDMVPTSYDDLLDERFHSSNIPFLLDVRPLNVAALVPAWGLDRVLEYAEQLAAQDPIWSRTYTGPYNRVAAGEFPILIFGLDNSALNVAEASDGRLVRGLIEPVPVYPQDVLAPLGEEYSDSPHAALLFLDWMMSIDGGQAIMDIEKTSSIHTEGSFYNQEVQGLEVSVIGPSDLTAFSGYAEAIVEAYGFPTAEVDG